MKPRTASAQKPFRAGLVAIVGRPNVGKSTLVNALLGEKIAIVSPHPQTTRERILGVLTTPDSQIAFLDTPGFHEPRHRLGVRMQNEAKEALRDADAVLFVCAAGKSASLSEADRAVLAQLPKVPIVCAVNKVDLVRPKSRLLPMLESCGAAHAFEAVIPISAQTKDGLAPLLAALRAHLPVGEALFDQDTLTDRSARFFVTEFVREQLLLRTRQEVPHGIAVTVDRYDEDAKRGPRIALTIHVPKESHKKIVVGRAGATLKEVGTAARIELERLLGSRVHLALWVRVTPDWFDDARALGELGFEVR